jgi:hypothetical protein
MISRLNRFLRARTLDDRGHTMSELVTVMFLLGVVLVIVVSVFSSFSHTFTEDRSSTNSARTANIGMNELTRVVRSGTENPVSGVTLNDPVFEFAGTEKVVLYAYLDTDSASPKPIKVQFSINANRELVETRWTSYTVSPGYFAFNTTASTSRVVARQIVAQSGTDPFLFTFYKGDGTTTLTPTGANSLTLAERRQIVAVKVFMKVQADPTARADPVTMQNTVGIPNLGVSRVGLGS